MLGLRDPVFYQTYLKLIMTLFKSISKSATQGKAKRSIYLNVFERQDCPLSRASVEIIRIVLKSEEVNFNT